MTLAYLGLGGNVGDVVASMSGALQRLDQHENITVKNVSDVFRTPPWGMEDQDWFHNACASLTTSLQSIELLEECLKIERIYKRERDIRWGPRTLDIDILLFGDETVSLPRLSIPHPRMQERAFVMRPLQQIAPDVLVGGKKPEHWLGLLADDSELEALSKCEFWWKGSA